MGDSRRRPFGRLARTAPLHFIMCRELTRGRVKISRLKGHRMSLSMSDRRLDVVGSGSLARSLCHSLAITTTPIWVTVIARNGAVVGEIVRGCRARAGVSGTPVSFSGEVTADYPEAIGRLRPDVVVCAASTQSP